MEGNLLVTLRTERKKGCSSTFLYGAPEFPKALEGSQASPSCASGKGSIKMKISTEQW
jgi:hypothetical protein